MILESLDEENACYEFHSLLVTEIVFSTDRRFSGLHCEQLERDIENPPHGFFPERTHLAFERGISPESDGF